MSRRRSLAGLLLAAAMPLSASEAQASFKIIVNPAVPGRTITKDVLAQIYLGKVQRWGDGQVIAAVDQSGTSAVRGAFSGTVLAMPIEAVRRHWLGLIEGGKRPPVTKATDKDVIDFVAGDAGAIGYVLEETPVPSTVRTVPIK